MSLSPDQKSAFKPIAELLAKELTQKVASLINRNATITFNSAIESCVNSGKFQIKRDSFLVTAPSTEPNLGPICLIATNQQVFVLADLIMGGDGSAADDVKPDETNQMVFAESINQVFKSTVQRLEKLKPDYKIEIGEHEYRQLQSIKDSSLTVPKDLENSVALEFKIKISAKLDSIFIVEVDQSFIESAIENFSEIASKINLTEFEALIKLEYFGENQEEHQEAVKEIQDIESNDTSGENAYKVDHKRNLGFLKDINLDLIVELGRSEMTFKNVMRLAKGSAIELDRQCNEPVDLYVHNQLVARGEVIAIDDCFGLKITQVIGNLDLFQSITAMR